jgi:hypothetical protein
VTGPRLGAAIGLGVGLSDNGFRSANTTAQWLGSSLALGALSPQAGDAYNLHLDYSDSTAADIPLTVTAFTRNPPTLIAPLGSIASTTPTFSWSNSVASATLRLDVRIQAGFNLWTLANVPGTQTSAVYNFDGRASGPLVSGTSYNWRLEQTDSNANMCVTEASFSVQ